MSENKNLVDATWEEIGKKAHPMRDLVFLRTDLRPEKDGMIWLPPSERGNYSGLGHAVLMTGTVMAVGPKCKILKRDDKIAFPRLHFGWLWKCKDLSLVGYIIEEMILGYVTNR